MLLGQRREVVRLAQLGSPWVGLPAAGVPVPKEPDDDAGKPECERAGNIPTIMGTETCDLSFRHALFR